MTSGALPSPSTDFIASPFRKNFDLMNRIKERLKTRIDTLKANLLICLNSPKK